MSTNKQIGNMGEEIAVKYLLENGYEIIARNVHYSRFCELDIVAKQKNTYVFIEVKTRKNNDFGTPFDAITATKYENIKKGTLKYISDNNIKNYRIDVVGITLQPKLEIKHLQNI